MALHLSSGRILLVFLADVCMTGPFSCPGWQPTKVAPISPVSQLQAKGGKEAEVSHLKGLEGLSLQLGQVGVFFLRSDGVMRSLGGSPRGGHWPSELPRDSARLTATECAPRHVQKLGGSSPVTSARSPRGAAHLPLWGPAGRFLLGPSDLWLGGGGGEV